MRTKQLFPLVMSAALLAGCADGDNGGGAAAAATTEVGGQTVTQVPTITVQGTGQASVAPDTMVAYVSMHTEAASAAQTLDENSLLTIQLQQTARDQGIADEDIQTSNITVYPRFDQNGRRVIGYGADNSFTLRFRDLETAGTQLDAIMGVGADFLRLNGLSLEIDDPTAALADARADAVRRAADQATQLADAAGVDLGPIRTISEVTSGGSFPVDFGGASAADESASIPVPISPGTQDVSLTVTMVYEIAG